jgi:hypothetical protein
MFAFMRTRVKMKIRVCANILLVGFVVWPVKSRHVDSPT